MIIYAKKFAGAWHPGPQATPMIGNTTGILTENLLVAAYAWSYLCIPVSTVVE